MWGIDGHGSPIGVGWGMDYVMHARNSQWMRWPRATDTPPRLDHGHRMGGRSTWATAQAECAYWIPGMLNLIKAIERAPDLKGAALRRWEKELKEHDHDEDLRRQMKETRRHVGHERDALDRVRRTRLVSRIDRRRDPAGQVSEQDQQPIPACR